MKILNIQEAKTHLSRLVEEAMQGEDLVIAKAGKPCVRLVAFHAADTGPRPLGALAGQVTETEDCWATDPDLESLFYGDFLASATPKVAEGAP